MKAPERQPNGYFWDSPDTEWRVHQYVTLYKTGQEISNEFGPTRPTILKWVQEAGISIRRGHVRPGRGTSHRQARARSVMLLEELGEPKYCAKCGAGARDAKGRIVTHHLDENPYNEDLDNLEYMCDSCHILLHRPWAGKEVQVNCRSH